MESDLLSHKQSSEVTMCNRIERVECGKGRMGKVLGKPRKRN